MTLNNILHFDKRAKAERARLARIELSRLAGVTPSGAAELTDEDFEIYMARFARIGKQFEFFVKAAYLDYATFFMCEMAKAVNRHEEDLA